MPNEDILLRVLRSSAQAILERRTVAGDRIDLPGIADETLQTISKILSLGEQCAALRDRLIASLTHIRKHHLRA